MLYRVRRHADRASDELFEEMTLCGPRGEYREPGPWVLDWLRKHDLSQGGSIDLGYARRRALDRYDELDRRRDEEEHRRLEALHASAGGDLYDYAVREKRHFTIGR